MGTLSRPNGDRSQPTPGCAPPQFPKRGRLLAGVILGALWCTCIAPAQDIDSNVTSRHRSQAVIADQIRNPSERAAFVALYRKLDPAALLADAQAFLAKYPDSAFLAQVYEVAAKSSFDTGGIRPGIEYAHKSLTLLPENPLLLVALADAQAGQMQNDEAIHNATEALRYLDEFARPISVEEKEWPEVKRRQQAIANFAIGRSQLQKALKLKPGDERKGLLQDARDSLSRSIALNPDDQESAYLLGIAQLMNGDLTRAAAQFAAVYARSGDYAPRALESLQQLYHAQLSVPASSQRSTSFQDFLAAAQRAKPLSIPAGPNPPPAAHPGKYAGSHACKDCHADIYRNWSSTGMARMFRPYQAENVIGDFQKNNEFYTGSDIQYLHGKLNITPGAEHKLFARMVVRSGKHYFDIQQPDGSWHSYPVDYTIGSKWQQAYATRLPNGQIHVFPIQYSVIEKKWLNYWRSLDGPGSERSDPYNFERLDSSTNYTEKCAVCHTSQLRNTKGGGLEADGLEFREPGIGCEMCHGPSASHVSGVLNGETYKKNALDPPVDFNKLDNRQFVAICAQCHRQAVIRDSGPHGELNYSTVNTFYRQGLNVPFGEFTRKGFYKDGRFSQTTFIVEALERSKCYRKGQVSCGTCHDPHSHDFSTNQTSLRYPDQPDKMCTGCHTEFQDNLKAAAHTRHAGEAGRCVACHMPRIMDALTFSARTHQIDDIPNAEMTARFGQQESPNACLQCHKEKSVAWLQEQLQAWKSTPSASPNLAEKTR
jgi:predicted CXXCH cytochrome family protein